MVPEGRSALLPSGAVLLERERRSNDRANDRAFTYTNAYGVQRIEAVLFHEFLDLIPPKSGPSPEIVAPLVPLLQELQEFDLKLFASDPVRTFGLEARVCHFLTEIEPRRTGLNPRHLLIRPAPEPVMYSHWNRFSSWAVDDASVIDLASCLAGRQVSYRQSTAASFPNSRGRSSRFPGADVSTKWISTLPDVAKGIQPSDGLSCAFHVLGSLVLNHPLEDGNGRCARAFFQGALARTIGLSGPMLALGPAVYARGSEMLPGWLRLGTSADWSALVSAYQGAFIDVLTYFRSGRA